MFSWIYFVLLVKAYIFGAIRKQKDCHFGFLQKLGMANSLMTALLTFDCSVQKEKDGRKHEMEALEKCVYWVDANVKWEEADRRMIRPEMPEVGAPKKDSMVIKEETGYCQNSDHFQSFLGALLTNCHSLIVYSIIAFRS